MTARKDSDHTPHRIPKHISRSETRGTRRSNVGNGEAPFSGNGNGRSTETARQRQRRAPLVSLLEPIFEEDAREAWALFTMTTAPSTRVSMCREGFSVAVPFSSSVHSRFQRLARLGHPSTAVSAAFPACRVSRNSLTQGCRRKVSETLYRHRPSPRAARCSDRCDRRVAPARGSRRLPRPRSPQRPQ